MAQSVSDQDFKQEVLEHQGVALVDFWAPWCGPCRVLGPVVEELAEEYAGRVKVLKLNVDENPRSPNEYGVQGIPMLLFFKDGARVADMVGVRPKQAIVAQLNELLTGAQV